MKVCPICNHKNFSLVFKYLKPPSAEIIFNAYSDVKYERKILSCDFCSHFISENSFKYKDIYRNDFVTSNYQDEEGIIKKFNQIISLSPIKSDNFFRTERIKHFVLNYFKNIITNLKILDIGSGLCVFLYRMNQLGFDCTALDPDIRSINHAIKNIGIKGIHGDFMEINNIGKFDIITFNKVLEHVKSPVSMLAKAKSFIKKNGLIYIEVPDGEIASKYGKDREEFFIDHIHVFSFSSLNLLIRKAGGTPLSVERIKEPSGKYTLFSFITK